MEVSRRESQTTKPPVKLRIFQLTQKNLNTVGISPNLLLQPCPLNTKIAIGFLIATSHAICNLVFIFFEAETFSEFTQTIYMGSFAILVIFNLVIFISNVENLFRIIDNCENLVNASESFHASLSIYSTGCFHLRQIVIPALKYSASRSIFKESVHFERKLSGLIFCVMLKVTRVCALVPWSAYNLFLCFTTDAENSAFELSFPIWYGNQSSFLNN